MTPLLTQSAEVVETTQVEFLNLPPVWALVLVIAPALVLFGRWLYARESYEGKWPWLPVAMRVAVIALVALFLFSPVRSKQRVRIEKPVAVLLVDDSASLRERDMPDLARDVGLPSDARRTDVVEAALDAPLDDLAERYEVLSFAFGTNLRAIASLDALTASDSATRLGDALAAAAAETRGREVGHVVVVSDGRVNAGRDVQAALSSLAARGVPVSTVGVGDPQIPRDVRVSQVTAPEVALAGDTVTLEVSIASRGYPGQASSLTVEDSRSGRELARTDVTLAEGTGVTEQMERISFVPDVEGDLDLVVRVEPLPSERDPSNNAERRMLRIEPGRIKVLYVDGYPRYEYRFLVSMLLRSRNLDVQCLLLDADEDFIQESSTDESLTRFPPRDALFDYHVIIFGDVLPQDLGPNWEQHLLDVKQFVEAGGGFLMQAGMRYAPRDYVDTPIADILPVLIGDRASELANVDDSSPTFRPQLVNPRDPHEIVTLHPELDTNLALWEADGGLAPLTWYYPVSKSRTTAEVQLIHPRSRNTHGPHVLLATMYYPQGRTAFLATDETWRWRLRYLETYREPFWRGLIRYLALNKLRRSDYRFDLSTDRSSYVIGERMELTARVQSASFQPLVAESFEAYLVEPDGTRETLDLEREQDGVFRGTVLASDAGPYRIWLEDPEADSGEPKSPRIVTVSVPSAETDDAVLDEVLLRSVADRTGGRYAHLSDVDLVLDGMNDAPTERPLDEPEREELWSGTLPLVLLVGLLSVEWIYRKRKNLV